MLSGAVETRTGSPATVLVVDDEQMIRWSIEQTLSASGFEVVCAGTGAEGLDLVRKLNPQVVFLDIRLPDADGLNILEVIKRESAGTAVIVMTAFEEESTSLDARRRGADDFLGKPFNFEDLNAIVGRALDRQAAV